MGKKSKYVNLYFYASRKVAELNNLMLQLKDKDEETFLKASPLIIKINKFVIEYNEKVSINKYLDFKKIILEIKRILIKNTLIESPLITKGIIKSINTGILCDYRSIQDKEKITFLECELYKNNNLIAKNFPKRDIYQSYFMINAPGSYHFILKYFIGKEHYYYKSDTMIMFNKSITKRNNY